MNEDDLRQLIYQAIAEIIAPQPRRALVLLTGGLLGFDEAINDLRLLRSEGVELDWIQTPSAERILDQRLIAELGMNPVQRHLVANHRMLIAPTMTGNLAAKVAHGISDCLASNVMSEFIMSGRIVVASRTAICPDDELKQQWFPQMPEGYANMLRQNLATLEGFGVRLAAAHAIARTAIAAFDRLEQSERTNLSADLGISPWALTSLMRSHTKPAPKVTTTQRALRSDATSTSSTNYRDMSLISQATIQALAPGSEIHIGPHTRMTALAKDLAGQRSIRIVEED